VFAQALCERYGKVMRCRVVFDPRTRQSRGYAFVRMATIEEADSVIRNLQGFKFYSCGVEKTLKVGTVVLCGVMRALTLRAFPGWLRAPPDEISDEYQLFLCQPEPMGDGGGPEGRGTELRFRVGLQAVARWEFW